MDDMSIMEMFQSLGESVLVLLFFFLLLVIGYMLT